MTDCRASSRRSPRATPGSSARTTSTAGSVGHARPHAPVRGPRLRAPWSTRSGRRPRPAAARRADQRQRLAARRLGAGHRSRAHRPPQPDRRSPLSGPRFVDLTDAWSPRLRALAHEADPTLAEGVYAMLPGPHYNTRAEAIMLADAGRRPGRHVHRARGDRSSRGRLELLGLSTVTTQEIDGPPIDPDEVVASPRQPRPGSAQRRPDRRSATTVEPAAR